MFDFSAESLDSAVKGAYGNKSSAPPQMPPRQKLSGANPQLQADEETPSTDGFSFDAVSLNNAVRDAIKGEPSKVSQVAKSKFGSMSELGQGLASLADVTVGGVIPAVAGSVTYAGARALGKTPEQATQLEQQVVAATGEQERCADADEGGRDRDERGEKHSCRTGSHALSCVVPERRVTREGSSRTRGLRCRW